MSVAQARSQPLPVGRGSVPAAPRSGLRSASMEGSVRCAYERLVFALIQTLSFQIRSGFCPYKVSATARRISQMHRAQHMRRWGGCVGRLVIRRRTFASKFVVPSARLHCNPPHHQHRSSETLPPSSDLSSTYEQSRKYSRANFFCFSDADPHDPYYLSARGHVLSFFASEPLLPWIGPVASATTAEPLANIYFF